MNIDTIVAQLQTFGPWGWIAAAVIVIYTTWRKKQTLTTPAAPAAQSLADRHAAVLAEAEALRQGLTAELDTLAKVPTVKP